MDLQGGSSEAGVAAYPFRGRLLDASTGEPIPEFLIWVRAPRELVVGTGVQGAEGQGEPSSVKIELPPKRAERVVTDAEGRFTTSGAFEAGTLDLLLIDHPLQEDSLASLPRMEGEEDGRIEHEHSFDDGRPPQEKVFRIDIGPTYRLDLDLPAGLEKQDFYACFPEPRSGSSANANANRAMMHRVVAEDPGSPFALFMGGISNPETLEGRAVVREGDPVWVRFSTPVWSVVLIERKGDNELHVRSKDGFWSGSATVTSVEGIYRELVPIEIAGRGAISGVVHDLDGEPVPSAWVRLAAAGADEPPREVGTDPQGRFTFKWLDTGDHVVRIESDRYQTWTAAVWVELGSTQELEATLTGKGALGKVSGVLRGRTGRHRSKGASMTLRSVSDRSFLLLKGASYRKRHGVYEAPFAFENIPAGEYELTLQPLDNMEWNTRRMVVSPPAEGLVFVCEDDVPLLDLGFRAIDAETGESIAETWSIVWQGEPSNDVRLDDDWETGLYRGVPDGSSLRWLLRAEGYRLATGDESAFQEEAETRIAEVRLVHGWGQAFKVTKDDQETPLADVELFADGRTIGRTDARGMVSMNLESRPLHIEFRLEGWHVSWGSVDPVEEGFGWGPETPVYLSRDDK